jgi:hypothetical protein
MSGHVRFTPNTGHSWARLACPLCADFVAKVGGPLQVRNFRIQWARRLNQSCAAGLFFESMLRVGMRKIFLQQYLPQADIAPLARSKIKKPSTEVAYLVGSTF